MTELTQESITRDMHKLRALLKNKGIDSSVEYPGFLVIYSGDRELHAGYSFDYDEATDGVMFQLYDFTDGYNHDFSITFPTLGDLGLIALTLHNRIAEYMEGRK